ncbi:MFS transporter [Albibacillus kandeliae]|uniref:MFS transporter n=1 Tax=Albibacillus kandeliae TaxID=2174228 RepID=UPI0018E5538C|nr:MFS transporter [Albibacillus kandeliae]
MTDTTMAPAEAPRALHDEISDRTRWLAFAAILLAQFMNLIDVTIVNVAIPSLQRNLGASESQIEWVVAGYILVFALLLLPMGRLGDIIGRKQLFLVGVAAFTIVSAICGMAGSIEMLVIARFLQGMAAAVMMPQVMAIAQNLFAPRHRSGAFSMFGLVAGLASVAGPILGGTLINADLWGLGWRAIFLINLPIGVIAFVAASRLVPTVPGNPKLRNDWIGILFMAAAMLALIFPLVEGRTLGWPVWCFALMCASPVFFAGFVMWEARQERLGNPQLMPITLLKAWNFAIGSTLALVYFSALPALFLVIALYLQSGYGFDPLHSGLTTVPFPVGILVASVINSRLGPRWQKQRILFGLTLLWIGIFWLRSEILATTDAVDHWRFLPALLMSGIGVSFSIAPMFQTILAGVPVKDAGAGSGALQAVQQAGSALGIAVVSQIFFSTLATAFAGGMAQHEAFRSAISTAMLYNLVAYVIVAACALLLKKPQYTDDRAPRAPMPPMD